MEESLTMTVYEKVTDVRKRERERIQNFYSVKAKAPYEGL